MFGGLNVWSIVFRLILMVKMVFLCNWELRSIMKGVLIGIVLRLLNLDGVVGMMCKCFRFGI